MKSLKILVATDLSHSTIDVISKTLSFAKKSNSEVDVLHIVESSFFGSIKDVETIYANTIEYLKEHLPEIPKERIHIKKGVVKQDVALEANRLGADMIVIGSSGESSFIEEMFLGSSTKEIERSSKIPVLVIKNIHELEYKRVLAVSDFSPASKKAIDETMELLPNSTITLFHSYSLPFESRLNVYGLDHEDALTYQKSIVRVAQDEANSFLRRFEDGESRLRYTLKRDGIEAENFRDSQECELNDLVVLHTTGHFSFIAFDILEASKLDVLIVSVDE